jgi:hypothetical protein
MKAKRLTFRKIQVRKFGYCRLCGRPKKLTDEHTPPKAAYNKGPVSFTSFLDLFASLNGKRPPIKKSSNGVKRTTLCKPCNSWAGGVYVPAFVKWTKQAQAKLANPEELNGTYLRYEIQPLNILKEIMLMRLAWVPVHDLPRYTAWRKYILNPEDKALPQDVRIFAYLNKNQKPRVVDRDFVVMKIDINALDYVEFELALQPLGYCITSTSGDNKSLAQESLTDITWFSEFDYNEQKELFIPLPLREAHISFPLEYRTKAAIDEHNQKHGIEDS